MIEAPKSDLDVRKYMNKCDDLKEKIDEQNRLNNRSKSPRRNFKDYSSPVPNAGMWEAKKNILDQVKHNKEKELQKLRLFQAHKHQILRQVKSKTLEQK